MHPADTIDRSRADLLFSIIRRILTCLEDEESLLLMSRAVLAPTKP